MARTTRIKELYRELGRVEDDLRLSLVIIPPAFEINKIKI